MPVEASDKSLPQQGRAANEDAFLILRDPVVVGAVCDGAGHAEQAAGKALRVFALWVPRAAPEDLANPATWTGWAKKLDSALLGGCETTFLATAVLEDRVVGVTAGDSQGYLVPFEGGFRHLLIRQ